MNQQKRKAKVRLQSLDRNYNTRVRWESLDADYLKQLNPETLKYYAQFIDEYVGGAISKNKDGTPKKGHLHNTKTLAKACYDSNNRRNNDLFSIAKATNRIGSLDRITEDKSDRVGGSFGGIGINNGDNTVERTMVKNPSLTEDAIISQIDSKEHLEQLTFKEYVKVRKHMSESRKNELDSFFLEQYPKAYMFYYLYDNTRITEGKLNKLLDNPDLLEKFVENFELFKRKKNRTYRGKRIKNSL